MQVQQRTADEWFKLWDQLAAERREIGEQWHAAPIDDWSEHEKLSRAYEVASARVQIAYIRFLMARYNISESEIADLMI